MCVVTELNERDAALGGRRPTTARASHSTRSAPGPAPVRWGEERLAHTAAVTGPQSPVLPESLCSVPSAGKRQLPPHRPHPAIPIPHVCLPAPRSPAPPRAPSWTVDRGGGAQVGSEGPEPPAYLIQAGNEPRGGTGEPEALLDGGEAALEVGAVEKLAELQEAVAEHEHLGEDTWAAEASR